MRTVAATTLTLASLTSLASAGQIFIDNFCPFSLWLTTSANGGPPDQGAVEIPAAGLGGVAPIPIAAPSDPAPNFQVNFANNPDMVAPFFFGYSPNLADFRMYYSFDTTLGDPIFDRGFEVLTNGWNPANPAVHCVPRAPDGSKCEHAFDFPGEPPVIGENLFYTNWEADFTVRLCKSDDP